MTERDLLEQRIRDICRGILTIDGLNEDYMLFSPLPYHQVLILSEALEIDLQLMLEFVKPLFGELTLENFVDWTMENI